MFIVYLGASDYYYRYFFFIFTSIIYGAGATSLTASCPAHLPTVKVLDVLKAPDDRPRQYAGWTISTSVTVLQVRPKTLRLGRCRWPTCRWPTWPCRKTKTRPGPTVEGFRMTSRDPKGQGRRHDRAPLTYTQSAFAIV